MFFVRFFKIRDFNACFEQERNEFFSPFKQKSIKKWLKS
jgi:hypothetical protein